MLSDGEVLEVSLASLDPAVLRRAVLWLPRGWLAATTRLGGKRINPSKIRVRGEDFIIGQICPSTRTKLIKLFPQ